MFPRVHDRRGERGSVLVLAAWSLTLLVVLAASLGYGVRQKAMLVKRLETRAELTRAALAGVEKARGFMKLPDTSPGLDTLMEGWANNAGFKDLPFGNAHVDITLVDEESKINLNTADTETLTRLFEIVAGLDADRSKQIAYAVVDWHDADPTRQDPEYGAEDDDYANLARPYESKDKPMDVIEELLLVKGMKREIFDKIRDNVTVYGGAVNINTARRETLQALGLGEPLVGKIFLYLNGIDGAAHTVDDRFFSSASQIVTELKNAVLLDMAEETALSNLVSSGKLATSSSCFMAKSRALEDGRGALEARAVIDRNGKIYTCRLFRS